MANPTVQVQSTVSDYTQTERIYPLATDVNRSYQTGQMLGRRSDGYIVDFDDAAALEFVGLLQGVHQQVSTLDTLLYQQLTDLPYRFSMPLSTGTASVVWSGSGGGAIGKIAYAVFSGTVTLDPSALTYANVVGRVVDILPGNPLTLTGSTSVVIEKIPARTNGARFLAATGNQTLYMTDLGKTVFVPNTANLSLTLPNLSLAGPSDWIKFIKTTSGANTTITLDGNASEDINGSATNANMTTQFDTIRLIAFNTTRWIIGDKIYT